MMKKSKYKFHNSAFSVDNPQAESVLGRRTGPPLATGGSVFNEIGTGFHQPQSMICYDRYLVVKAEGERLLCRQSPFMIRRLFHNVQSIKRLKSGDYLIETSSEGQSRHYLQTKKVGEFPVTVIPHIGLNRVKGVVESDDLKYTNKEELLEEMKDKGIMDCYFFQKKQTNGDLTNTGRVVLTFRGQRLPDSVNIAGYLNCRVRKYIPDPLRCFKCQR